MECRMLRKFVFVMGAALMLCGCADFPLGPVKDDRPDPAKKGAPWPTCLPRESPACAGQ